MPALLKAMRPHQWVKNVFVLAALVFWLAERFQLGDFSFAAPQGTIGRVALALIGFCLASSSIYLLNDILDREQDRQHPIKRHRPIAAGAVSIEAASALCVAAAVGALVLGWITSTDQGNVALVLAAYMVLNLLYSLKLKHVVLVDVFCIATGFMLRVVAGGFAAGAPVSKWLMLCTFFLALFLALCKRKAETDLLGSDRGEHRKILLEYTPAFLDQTTVVLAACAILNYTMYTVDRDTVARLGDDLVWTVPFVVFGLFRYLLLVQKQEGGGSPSKVLLGGDVTFALNGLAWLAVVLFILFR